MRHRRRQPDGEQPRAVGLGGLGGDAAQPGQFGAQLLGGARDVGRRLDLAAGQLELQLDASRLGAAGDGLVAGHRLAGVGVDEQELFLDAEGGMAGHDCLEVLIRPVGGSHDGPDRAVAPDAGVLRWAAKSGG